MVKKKICVLLSALACLCFGVAGNALKEEVQPVQAETQAIANTFEMIPGASVRIDERHGIRFGTLITEDMLDAWEAEDPNFELGTAILPKNVLEAAGKTELTVNFRYQYGNSVWTPSIAVWNKDETTLVTNEDFPGYKVFNAVLELTDVVASNPDFLKQELVARTYVKLNGRVTYAGTVIRSAAYVGAASLDGGDADGIEGGEELLSAYVQHLESVTFDMEQKQYNLHLGDSIDTDAFSVAVVPANVYPIKYTSENVGVQLEGSTLYASKTGISEIKVGVANNKKYDTLSICVIGEQKVERKYYATQDVAGGGRNAGTEFLTINAYNVTEIKYNGATLKSEQDYTVDGSEVNISKAILSSTDKRVNSLQLISEVSGSVTVNVTVDYNQEGLPDSFDYYSSNPQTMGIYAYHSVRDASVTQDDDGTPGDSMTTWDATDADGNPIDFYDQAYIEDYYSAGLEYLFGGSAAGIAGLTAYPNLESASDLKRTLDAAHALGKDGTVIVSDDAITDLVRLVLANNYGGEQGQGVANTSLDTDSEWEANAPTFFVKTNHPTGDWKYADEDALDAIIEARISRYCDHPAFGGILLYDEPNVQKLRPVAELYASIQRVLAKKGLTDKKIVVNLLPFYPGQAAAFGCPTTVDTYADETNYKWYRSYLDHWLKESGAKDLQMDIYSLYEDGIYRYHLVNLQIAAEVATANGAKISDLTSCWQRLGDGGERLHDYEDLQWMNNAAMAYGAESIGYYTYHTLNDKSDQVVSNDGSMVNRQGEKTARYDYVRELNAKAQVFAPVYLNFTFRGSKLYTSYTTKTEFSVSGGGMVDKSVYHAKLKTYLNSYASDAQKSFAFSQVTDVSYGGTKYSWIVNELYDATNGNMMYAVMNVNDTIETGVSDTAKKITLTFATDMTHAWVYHDGVFSVMSLSANHTLDFTMEAGEAYFIIPFMQEVDNDYIAKPGDNWDGVWA